MDDLLGLGRGVDKLLDVIASACGVLYRPTSIRRDADAEAYKIRVLARANAESAVDSSAIAAGTRTAPAVQDAANLDIGERAVARALNKQLTQQENLERVFASALRHVPADVSPEPIDPNWLNTFVFHAEEAYGDSVQELWGKILAGETKAPGSYSRKAMETLKGMTQLEAATFQCACELASSLPPNSSKMIIYDCGSISGLSFAKPEEIALTLHGLGYTDILLLRGLGLLHPETLQREMTIRGGRDKMINYNGVRIEGNLKKQRFKLYFHSFTEIGNTLSRLIQPSPQSDYIRDLKRNLSWAFTFSQKSSGKVAE